MGVQEKGNILRKGKEVNENTGDETSKIQNKQPTGKEGSYGAGGRARKRVSRGRTRTEDYDKHEWGIGMNYGVRIGKRSMATTHH